MHDVYVIWETLFLRVKKKRPRSMDGLKIQYGILHLPEDKFSQIND